MTKIVETEYSIPTNNHKNKLSLSDALSKMDSFFNDHCISVVKHAEILKDENNKKYISMITKTPRLQPEDFPLKAECNEN